MGERVAVGVVVLLVIAGGVQADIINGGFETGDLTGWNNWAIGGSISAGSSPVPYEGSYDIGIVGLRAGMPYMLQEFSANAGDTVSFMYQYNLHDAGTYSVGRVTASVGYGTDGIFLVNVDNSDPDNWGTNMISEQWQKVSYVCPDSGTYTIEFAASNSAGTNDGTFAVLYVDDVRLTPVPEPATMGLLALGLTGLVMRRKRK